MFVILSKPNCPFWDKAKDLLADMNIPFTEFSIEDHPVLRDFIKAQGQKTVPQIYQDGRWVGGYENLQSFLGGF